MKNINKIIGAMRKVAVGPATQPSFAMTDFDAQIDPIDLSSIAATAKPSVTSRAWNSVKNKVIASPLVQAPRQLYSAVGVTSGIGGLINKAKSIPTAPRATQVPQAPQSNVPPMSDWVARGVPQSGAPSPVRITPPSGFATWTPAQQRDYAATIRKKPILTGYSGKEKTPVYRYLNTDELASSAPTTNNTPSYLYAEGYGPGTVHPNINSYAAGVAPKWPKMTHTEAYEKLREMRALDAPGPVNPNAYAAGKKLLADRDAARRGAVAGQYTVRPGQNSTAAANQAYYQQQRNANPTYYAQLDANRAEAAKRTAAANAQQQQAAQRSYYNRYPNYMKSGSASNLDKIVAALHMIKKAEDGPPVVDESKDIKVNDQTRSIASKLKPSWRENPRWKNLANSNSRSHIMPYTAGRKVSKG